MSAVSPHTAQALQEAMQRLLDGQPQRTDGALTVANLAREAGVARATANRATDLVSRFRAEIAQRAQHQQADVPATLRERVRRLDAELAKRKRADQQETRELRQTVRVLAQHVQALTLENEALRKALADHGDIRMLPGHHPPPAPSPDPERGPA